MVRHHHPPPPPRHLTPAAGRTLRSLVEEALRARLAPRPRESVVEPLPVRRPTRPGTHPGVDLTDNAALRDLMDHG